MNFSISAFLLLFYIPNNILGHLSHTGDLLLSVYVRRRPSLVNFFISFSGTTKPISGPEMGGGA